MKRLSGMEGLRKLLNVEIVEAGDTFFTPAGRVHAIGAGIVLVEIQQTSDITYRILTGTGRARKGKKRAAY